MERKERQPNEQLLKKLEIYLKKKEQLKKDNGTTTHKRRDNR